MGSVRIGGREEEPRQCRRATSLRADRAGLPGFLLREPAGPHRRARTGRDGHGRCVPLRYPLRRPSVSGKPPGFQYPYRHYQYPYRHYQYPYRNYQYPYRNHQHPYRNHQHPYRSSHETLIALLSTLIAMVQPRARRRDGRHRVAGIAPRGPRANKHTSKQGSKETNTPTNERATAAAGPRQPAPSGVASRQPALSVQRTSGFAR